MEDEAKNKKEVMLKTQKLCRIARCMSQPRGFALLLLPCLILYIIYLLVIENYNHERIAYLASKIDFKSSEIVDGYLVSNPKCHLASRNPLDPSILNFVKKEKYQNCSTSPLVTKIIRTTNGNNYLVVIREHVKRYKYTTCCYAPVHRPQKTYKDDEELIDFTLRLEGCKNFDDKVLLNNTVEVVLVRCRSSHFRKPSLGETLGQSILDYTLSNSEYSNVHAVLSPAKVQDKLVNFTNTDSEDRKLSVLVIGLDGMSRLNFQRTMPLTKEYLDEQGWLNLRGYTKIGDNTFPNLMAVLTGLKESMANFKSTCNPYKSSGLDKCPLIWYAFRKAGYVTAYGEDAADISTFNYIKPGFTDPPTDFYLRPYIVATEKFLSTTWYYGSKYCTGPEPSFFRILNYAQDFAQTFINQPYFGFFWTNSASHDELNAASSIDEKFLDQIREMEKAGVMNDSMVIILSDHGMRFGDFRKTVIGSYEGRLPVVYISLPPWFIEQNPEAYSALSINQNRLTSPYDLYETLRDVLTKAGGKAPDPLACLNCTSLFEVVPDVRGCSDAGVDAHWCACSTFEDVSSTDKVIVQGAHKFLEFLDDIVKDYIENGKRQCAKFGLKKIHRTSQMKDFDGSNSKALKIFYLLEVEPGGAMYETTANYDGNGKYVFREQDISRVNMYKNGSACLKKGKKMFCECV